MPGLASDPGDSLVPCRMSGTRSSTPSATVSIPRSSAFMSPGPGEPPSSRVPSSSNGRPRQQSSNSRPRQRQEDGVSEEEIGGKVMEVKLGAGDGEISEAQRRRIAYGSIPAFALLQSRKHSLAAVSRMSASSIRKEWWQHVLEYSRHISDLLGNPMLPSSTVIEDPKIVLQPQGEPTRLKAAWQLREIFYVDKLSLTWLPERLVDWLADYDSLLTTTETTIHSKIAGLQKRLANLQVVEDDPEYYGKVRIKAPRGVFVDDTARPDEASSIDDDMNVEFELPTEPCPSTLFPASVAPPAASGTLISSSSPGPRGYCTSHKTTAAPRLIWASRFVLRHCQPLL